jgi:hypothetical protein
VDHYGIEERGEVLVSQSTSGGSYINAYDLLLDAIKVHCPVVFEIKRAYNPSKHEHSTPGFHSFHRFVITEGGSLGIVLQKIKSEVHVQSVAHKSLGELYGLKKDDILCRSEKMQEFDSEFSRTLTLTGPCTICLHHAGSCIIAVWQALPTLMADTSKMMPKSTSGKNENLFIFSFPIKPGDETS